MAKALLVKTRNGSWVTAKIAGMESTAKMMSVVSTRTRTMNSGVATHLPAFFTQNFCPWYSSVDGTRLLAQRSTGLRDGSISSLRWVNIFQPV